MDVEVDLGRAIAVFNNSQIQFVRVFSTIYVTFPCYVMQFLWLRIQTRIRSNWSNYEETGYEKLWIMLLLIFLKMRLVEFQPTKIHLDYHQ